MPTALDTVPNLTVRNLTRGFNQAAVLTAEHAIKIDDPAALPANSEVTFTDPDLGFLFSGRITARSELWRGGEGIVYTCADVFRTMAKEPAKLSGSTKIEITERTSGKQLIEDLLDEYIANGNPLAGGYDTTNLEDVEIEPMDMAGQSLFEWIDTVLRQTEESVCWIEYDGSDDPVLMFDRLSLRPTLDLVVGDYEVVDPETDDNPLIVGADQLGADFVPVGLIGRAPAVHSVATEPETAHLQTPQRLLERLLECPPDGHRLADALHQRGQLGVGLGKHL